MNDVLRWYADHFEFGYRARLNLWDRSQVRDTNSNPNCKTAQLAGYDAADRDRSVLREKAEQYADSLRFCSIVPDKATGPCGRIAVASYPMKNGMPDVHRCNEHDAETCHRYNLGQGGMKPGARIRHELPEGV